MFLDLASMLADPAIDVIDITGLPSKHAEHPLFLISQKLPEPLQDQEDGLRYRLLLLERDKCLSQDGVQENQAENLHLVHVEPGLIAC